ncbi:hypothetical protein PCASD_03931 [Puccinia coronata f. sp. avenae]|uniref:Uncharacterized protein n=1 Tax=Puccinia coronata f. sp. avenae TaxID=200324 RepID=A0A2N5VAR1_9BASI|nr:hypothetical protein PCASD_03931 [Puccinia coronata f. sp. avenae]
MTEEGFQRGNLTTGFVGNPVEGVGHPRERIAPERLWERAIEKDGPGHICKCPVELLNHSILVMVIWESTFRDYAFLIQTSAAAEKHL